MNIFRVIGYVFYLIKNTLHYGTFNEIHEATFFMISYHFSVQRFHNFSFTPKKDKV